MTPAALDAHFRSVVQHRLRAAMKARDTIEVGVARAVVSGIDNAGAQPIATPADTSLPDPAVGLGAAEVQRRDLDAAALRDIITQIRAEHETMIVHLEAGDHADRVADERRAIELLGSIRVELDALVSGATTDVVPSKSISD